MASSALPYFSLVHLLFKCLEIGCNVCDPNHDCAGSRNDLDVVEYDNNVDALLFIGCVKISGIRWMCAIKIHPKAQVKNNKTTSLPQASCLSSR